MITVMLVSVLPSDRFLNWVFIFIREAENIKFSFLLDLVQNSYSKH